MSRLTVQMLHQQARDLLELTLLAGREGKWRVIESFKVGRPGLALTGHVHHRRLERIQVLGLSELSYLNSLDAEEQAETLGAYMAQEPPCIVVTRGLSPPQSLLDAAEKHRVCVFATPLLNSVFMDRATEFLDDRLSQTTSIHGVLVDVLGVGVLIRGGSGVGKSEVALDLVVRGHRLVADDIVDIRKKPPDVVYGAPSEIIQHHMEIRGLGIINVRDLFGVTAVRQRKKIDLVVDMRRWDPEEEYERLGVEDHLEPILGVPIPHIVLPLRAGRMISTLIEVAARDRLLKDQGVHSARRFQERLGRAIEEASVETSDDQEVE